MIWNENEQNILLKERLNKGKVILTKYFIYNIVGGERQNIMYHDL